MSVFNEVKHQIRYNKMVYEGDYVMKFIFAGGAKEVGGSCIYLRCSNKGILMDAGIRQSANKDPIPDFQSIQDAGGVDAILISHAHMDHIGTLPIISKAYPNAKIYMTPMSMELTRILLKDSLKIMGRRETEIPHYSESDVMNMMERIVPVSFQLPYGILDDLFTFTFYPAGHIAGAACISLRTPEGDVFYSGDFSSFRQRTIEGVRIPKLRPDIGIFESTYGNRLHSNRETEENRLIETVKECAEKGMKLLIPSFALGRAQEVLLILQSAMKSKKLPEIPVYVDGMVRDINRAYMNHPNDLRLPLARTIQKGNDPFYSDTVRAVGSADNRSELLNQKGCAVFVSSSGMLTGGPSLEYAKKLVGDENACIIITGYQDEEAPGRTLLNMLNEEGDKTVTLDGTLYQLKCRVVQVGLSAHSDSAEISAMIDRLSCRRVILVHGDEDAMSTLGSELASDYRKHIYEPSCGTALEFTIHEKRKQILSSFTETLHKEDIADQSDIADIWSFWEEHYAMRSLTVQEVYMLATGKQVHAERLRQEEKDALDSLQSLLENSVYISRDPKRLFLFHLNSEEEIQEKTKKRMPTMQDVQLILNKELNGIVVRKTGFYQPEKTVSIVVDFPDAFNENILAEIQKEVNEKTGWKVTLSPAINHQAASLLLLRLFGNSLGKVSHYDNDKTYNITLSQDYEDHEEKKSEFEKETGWKLFINESNMPSSMSTSLKQNKNINDFFYPSHTEFPKEINMAYQIVDMIFSDSPIRPSKKSLMTDQYGKYICLTFLSPQLGYRCKDLIFECADKTAYRIGIKKAVNQNQIQLIIMNLCSQYGITLEKNPSYLPEQNCFEIKTDVTSLPEEMADEFEERTGLTLHIKK